MTFQAGASLPAARSTDLVTTETADSLLVYDQDRHELHTLNSTAAAIWRLLDGQRSATDVLVVARADLGSELTLEAVQLALATLAEAHLLADAAESSAFTAGESRRRFLKKAGIVAIPAVISVSVPLAAAHASTCGAPGCFTYSTCQANTIYSYNSTITDPNYFEAGVTSFGLCCPDSPQSGCKKCLVNGRSSETRNGTTYYGWSVSCT